MSYQQLPTFTIWVLSLKGELLNCGGFTLHICSSMKGSNGSAINGGFRGGTEGDFWQHSFPGQKEVVLFPRLAFGTWPRPTLHSILCHTLDEMLEIWIIAADLTKHFENRWGKPTVPSQHLLHHTAISLLSTEMGCHAEIYFASHCWSYQSCHSWQSPVTAALPLPTDSLKRCCMISDKLHYRL